VSVGGQTAPQAEQCHAGVRVGPRHRHGEADQGAGGREADTWRQAGEVGCQAGRAQSAAAGGGSGVEECQGEHRRLEQEAHGE